MQVVSLVQFFSERQLNLKRLIAYSNQPSLFSLIWLSYFWQKPRPSVKISSSAEKHCFVNQKWWFCEEQSTTEQVENNS